MKRSVVVLACLWMASATASAQEQLTRVEVGGQVSGLGVFLNDATLDRADAPAGIGGWLDVGITQRLALDTQVMWFPTNEQVEFESQGGKTLLLSVGLRIKLVASPRFFMYGVIAPGFVHFTTTNTGTTDTSLRLGGAVIGGATHPMLHAGWGFEFYPTSRWIARFEFGASGYRTPGFYNVEPDGTGYTAATSETLNEVSASIGYRVGSLHGSIPRESFVTERDAPATPHAFFDAADIALDVAEAGTLIADYVTTQVGFKRNPQAFVETNPIQRPFVRAGWAGEILSATLFSTADLGLQYALHRAGHHRAERLLALFFIASEAGADINNARRLAEPQMRALSF
jgi:hypothetical protein